MMYFNLLHVHLQHLYIGTNFKCQYYGALQQGLFYFASMNGKHGKQQECNGDIKRSLENVQCGRRTKRCHCWIFSSLDSQKAMAVARRPHGYPSARTCIPKLDFITKNWSTSFLWRGLISWGTNFSCTARPNSRICALKRKNPHQWLCLKGVCSEPYITADRLHPTKGNNCRSSGPENWSWEFCLRP